MKIYTPSDKLDFGKNYGLTLREVHQFQPSYIEWAILNREEFCIDIAAFNNLADPTTITYEPQAFNPEHILHRRTLEFNLENINQFLLNVDSYNHHIDVAYIKDEIGRNPDMVKTLTNFEFPIHIRAINSYKIYSAQKREEETL